MRAVFLDRDGVLNRPILINGKPHAPRSLAEFDLLPGVPDACSALAGAGYLLVVATNQPDVARGLVDRGAVDAMHARLMHDLPLRDIRVCWDLDTPESRCHKPKPGMLLDAAETWDIDLAASYMVGDRWRDVGCGKAAGCYTILIDYGYPETRDKLTEQPDAVCGSLAEAAAFIINRPEQAGQANA